VFILKIDIFAIKNIGLRLEAFSGVRAIKCRHKIPQSAAAFMSHQIVTSEKQADHGQEEMQGAS
jgi:hypothetical protein